MTSRLTAEQIDPLRNFLERGTPPGFRHFHNAHFPGLSSIVLAADGECLTRIFAAAPLELHDDLKSQDGTFLWHAHGYDFTETTLLGTVQNIVIQVGSSRIFHEYVIEAGIATGRNPTLRKIGKRAFDTVLIENRRPSESFSMTHEKIHRVVFFPCERTVWFACLVQERNKCPAPATVFCERELDAVPNADVLYREMSEKVAKCVVQRIFDVMEPTSF